MVDVDAQREIWHTVLGAEGVGADRAATNLVVTEPVFNFTSLRGEGPRAGGGQCRRLIGVWRSLADCMDELVFEELQFAGMYRASGRPVFTINAVIISRGRGVVIA